MQPLWGADRYAPLAETVLNDIEQFSLTDGFSECIERWHDVTAVAILAEPVSAERMFGRLRMPPGRSVGDQRDRTRAYWNELSKLFHAVGLNRIEAARKEMCEEVLLMDPNKDFHNLIRLTVRRTGLDVRGDIGLAICVRVMAEAVRRAAEDAFQVELPEEDECGFGWGEAIRNFKQTTYGGTRVLDDDSVAKAFLKEYGLDLGLKVRWYVEGETECGFLEYVLRSLGTTGLGTSGIEIRNLRGQVAQAKGLIPEFRDSLRNDIKLEIFSLVTVDADRGEIARAVRAAIDQGEFFGRVFMPPTGQDFEFGNFALDELAEVLWRIAAEQGVEEAVRDRICAAVQGATSGKEVINLANQAVQPGYRFNKGESWGRALAVYFLEKPAWPDGGPRPVREAIVYAYRVQDNQYAWTRNKYRVDPVSGKMVPRTNTGGNALHQ
jgi:hypothetical protein